MQKCRNSHPSFNVLLLIGVCLAVVGLIFYANFRSGTWLHQLVFLDLLQLEGLPAPTHFILGSLPSFLFVAYMALFSHVLSVAPKASTLKRVIFWCAVSSFSECIQLAELNALLMVAGTFDPMDLVATLLGGLTVYFLIGQGQEYELETRRTYSLRNMSCIPISMLALASITGTVLVEDYCDMHRERCVSPVYLTLETLRSDIEPEYGNTAELTRPGKIYLYQHYLLVADKYSGIHIFDNTDQQNPMRLMFLPIFGATEISIRNNYLYTNSFMDLVSLNLQDLLDANFTSESYFRHIDQFERPYKYDFVPSRLSFTDSYLIPDDPESDIVIGYQTKDGTKHLYGDNND